jgi:hypothetical protein
VVRALEAASGNRYVPPYAFALVHAGLGNRARSLKWLECACDGHDVHLTLPDHGPQVGFSEKRPAICRDSESLRLRQNSDERIGEIFTARR